MSAPLAEARAVAERVVAKLQPHAARIEIAGSIRRRTTFCKDIEIVAMPQQVPADLFGGTQLGVEELTLAAQRIGRPSAAGPRFVKVEHVLDSYLTLDLFIVHGHECSCADCIKKGGGNSWGAIYTIRTGPASFSQELVTRIRGRLWACEGGFVRDDRGRYVETEDEQAFFAAAQTEWVEPERRG